MNEELQKATDNLKKTLTRWSKLMAEKQELEDLMVAALEHYSKIHDKEDTDGKESISDPR